MLIQPHLFISDRVWLAMDIRQEDMPSHLSTLDKNISGGARCAVETTLRARGVKIEPGSGTGAAADHFREIAVKSAASRDQVSLMLAS